VAGCGGHDDAADGAVAGVEDVVEALFQQGRGPGGAALHDGDRVRWQVGGQQPRERGGRGGGELTGFDHRGVTGRERPDQRDDYEVQGVVPRRDDQHHAQWTQLCPGFGRAQLRCSGDGLGLQPVVEVSQDVVDLAHGVVDLGAVCLDRALAEVGVERLGELRPAVHEHGAQAAQKLLATGYRSVEPAAVGGAQPGHGLRRLGNEGHDGSFGRSVVPGLEGGE
jgi:hypothetical protein